MALEWEFGFATDPGLKRKDAPNQDIIRIFSPSESGGKAVLLIVADGMGGYTGGEVASWLVVETICKTYAQAGDSPDYQTLLKECLVAAHQVVLEYAKNHEELVDMGSTAVVAALDGSSMWVANIGDSRAYILNSDLIEVVSYDHSMVADHVRAGLLSLQEAQHHPRRNRLTQSISARRPQIEPYTMKKELSIGESVILCTDGLWGVVSEAVIQAVALEFSPQAAAEKLVSLTYTGRAPDNVSVIVARQMFEGSPVLVNNDITDPGL